MHTLPLSKKMPRRSSAFTLIELMIVLAIISIMATMAIPNYQDRIIKSQIMEAIGLAEMLKQNITEFHTLKKSFPKSNQEAGLPAAQHLIGNYVTQVQIEDGAIHVHLGNRINLHVHNKTLTLRPAVVVANADSPIDWLCGNAQAVTGMQGVGENKTDIANALLPLACRHW